MEDIYYFTDGDTVEIDARVLTKDFDDADKEIIAQQMYEASLGDNDEEMAQKFGYQTFP